MKQTLIALSIPVFVFFIFLEAWLAKRRQITCYRFSDALTDLGCGVGSQISVFYFGKTLHETYAHLFQSYRLFDLGDGVAVWLLAFVVLDLLYYWFHRLSHEINLLWAVHIVHHQSEDYNLAVSLRQAVLTVFVTWIFYVPMAFLGIPPLVFGVMHAFNLMYQFWIHTELIRSLGPLEYILNTPSHHRVHHGQNPQYLDKNYGGTLICWDYLFGTFVKEEEPVVYGITKPLRSYNSVWAQFHYFFDLWRECKAAPLWQDKIKVWLKGPAWSPQGLPPKLIPYGISRESFQKFDPPAPSGLHLYLALSLTTATVTLFVLMVFGAQIPGAVTTLLVISIVLSLLSLGALLEQKPWALRLEISRLGFLLGASVGVALRDPLLWRYALAIILLSLVCLLWLRSKTPTERS